MSLELSSIRFSRLCFALWFDPIEDGFINRTEIVMEVHSPGAIRMNVDPMVFDKGYH